MRDMRLINWGIYFNTQEFLACRVANQSFALAGNLPNTRSTSPHTPYYHHISVCLRQI